MDDKVRLICLRYKKWKNWEKVVKVFEEYIIKMEEIFLYVYIILIKSVRI